MTLTIEQIEEQIFSLQKTLEELKNPKMEVSRNFTGQYLKPYRGMQYRRMESEGIPIWECYLGIKKEWAVLDKKEAGRLEEIFLNDCVPHVDETVEETE